MKGHKELKTFKICNFDNPNGVSTCNKCGRDLVEVTTTSTWFSQKTETTVNYINRWKCLNCGAVNMGSNVDCHGCNYSRAFLRRVFKSNK